MSLKSQTLDRVLVGMALVGFIGTVYSANVALAKWGIVGIGFGLTAPAGVFFAGLAFTMRDLLHDVAGRRWVIIAILVGAGLSAFLEDAQKFAVASAVAFLVSETVDLLVYTPLAARGWLRAVLASNIVGFTLDSILFLWLAFGSLQFLTGQLVGKGYMTLGAILFLWTVRWISTWARTNRTGYAS